MTSQNWAGRLGEKGQLSASHRKSDSTFEEHTLSPTGLSEVKAGERQRLEDGQT